MFDDDDESLGMSILKGLGKALWKAMDPDNLAKMQEKNERWAARNIGSDDPRKQAAAQKIMDQSSASRARIRRLNNSNARAQMQEMKAMWDKRNDRKH